MFNLVNVFTPCCICIVIFKFVLMGLFVSVLCTALRIFTRISLYKINITTLLLIIYVLLVFRFEYSH